MRAFRQAIAVVLLTALALVTGIAVSAQDKPKKTEPQAGGDVIYVRSGNGFSFQGQESADGPRMWVGDSNTAYFVSSEMMTNGRAVKGAPYSAQGVTETVQTLADGNRIVRRTTSNLYRDSEGRTRNEQVIGNVGPYATESEPSQIVSINDPVAGAHYMLEPHSKTARKMMFLQAKLAEMKGVLATASASESKGMTTFNLRVDSDLTPEQAAKAEVMATTERRAAAMAGVAPGVPIGAGTFNVKLREPKIEQLGRQTIEGVDADGQRSTITIPAGEIGNEAPIQIVSETWYSPDLQVTVMSRHSDPRFGETTYKLTNINRAEPAHSLFEIPADYTVKDGMGPMKMKIERDTQRPRKPADQQND